MDDALTRLTAVVQHNCDVADAKHAREHSLCVYLLKMREYFRWEKGLPFTAPLPRAEVAEWLSERERFWDGLEDAPLEPIPVGRAELDPFHSDTINGSLGARGLVYSAGLGQGRRPHFFLGRMLRVLEPPGGFRVLVAGDEYARDLTAPPAMAQGKHVFVRRESLRRLLWERYEQWRWRGLDDAMARAIGGYDFESDLEGALEQMTEHEIEPTMSHELGEAQAGQLLGEEWNEMLLSLPRSRAELQVRAVRDHLADCLSTLPSLIEADNQASLHFYIANLSGMRRHLFPSLVSCYERWVEGAPVDELRALVHGGREHWESLAASILQGYRQGAEDWITRIEELVEQRVL